MKALCGLCVCKLASIVIAAFDDFVDRQRSAMVITNLCGTEFSPYWNAAMIQGSRMKNEGVFDVVATGIGALRPPNSLAMAVVRFGSLDLQNRQNLFSLLVGRVDPFGALSRCPGL